MAAKRKARLATKDPWDLLEIDWEQYHPDARQVLDDPFFWETANDLAPNGNDTGADLLADYLRWNRRNATESPVKFLDRTTKHVLDGTHLILLVSHDEEGDWQFLCETTNRPEDGRIVCLATVVEQHSAVVELADLPVGWQAMRNTPDQPWQRVMIEPEDEHYP